MVTKEFISKRLNNFELRRLLDSAYNDYHNLFNRAKDPVRWPHSFGDKADKEIAAFLAAMLAYGNVTSIQASLQTLFGMLGHSPSNGLFSPTASDQLASFYHRFNRGIDLQVVFHWLRHVLERHGSIEKFFTLGKHQPIRERLSDFVRRFTSIPLPRDLADAYTKRRRNIDYLIPSPKRGSSCKRLNLFLRWVVRPSDGIDLGLWNSISPSDLVLPIDTHILRTIRALGWTKSKAARWITAEEATKQLLRLSPNDPIRYDFSLCHLSMSGISVAQYYEKMG